MKQREVTDKENVRWTCMQAFSMTENSSAEKAANLWGDEDGLVMIVCTPSGGAQSVRIKLEKDWQNESSDEELLRAIEKERKKE